MKTEMLEKLDGYKDIIQEIEVSRKYGSSYLEQRGEIAKYINRLHPRQVDLKVVDIITETNTTKTLRFSASQDYLPPFRAGQYISLFLEIEYIKTTRPYSISSSPTEKGFWDLTIKRVENGLASGYLLDNVKIGDKFRSTGPQGVFCHNPLLHGKDILCLAGGSGITPFVSMIREIVSRGLDRNIYIIYGSKTEDDAIFHEELIRLSERNRSIHYIPVIEHPTPNYFGQKGFIDSELIRETVGSLQDKSVFICGPQAMYDFCEEQLDILKFPRWKLRKEMYGVPVNAWQSPGWPKGADKDKLVAVYCNGEKIGDCKSGESLLSVLEHNHKPVQTVCRSGECSMCRVKLIKGEVFQPHGTRLRKADQKFGFIYACASYPLTDIEIRI